MTDTEPKRREFTRRDVIAIAALSALLIVGVAIGYARDRARRRSVRVIPAPQERFYRININSAKEAELSLLPAIGPARARWIVAYREEHGPFPSVAALANVAGVSESVVRKLARFAEALPPRKTDRAQEQASSEAKRNPTQAP